MVKVLYALAALGCWWLATAMIFTDGLLRGKGEPASALAPSFLLYLLMVVFIVQVAQR
jgi:hypothetical protein